jgi:hypothetical protein
MKALLLVENDDTADIIKFYLKPIGFELIRYRNPLKAIDNLEEVEPDAIVVSARDFPRHWKPLVSMVRMHADKSRCVIILLKGEQFPFDEAAKAAFLDVNGVVKEDLGERGELARFQALIKRYVSVEDQRIAERIAPSAYDRLDFVFARPGDLTVVTGRIDMISVTGLSFTPELEIDIACLKPGDSLEDCTMRIGDEVTSLSCEVVRKGKTLGLKFTKMEAIDRARLSAYLKAWGDRELQARIRAR